MVSRLIPALMILAAFGVAFSSELGRSAQAEAAAPVTGPGQNYYVAPGMSPGVPAKLYPSPLPTPPRVGHTYITYEPNMPHEYLYEHKRTYVRFNPCAGVTRTRACWCHDFFLFTKLANCLGAVADPF